MLSASYVDARLFFFALSLSLSFSRGFRLFCFATRVYNIYLFWLYAQTMCCVRKNKCGLHTVPLTITISIKVYTKGIFKSVDKTLICQWHARSSTCSMWIVLVCVFEIVLERYNCVHIDFVCMCVWQVTISK